MAQFYYRKEGATEFEPRVVNMEWFLLPGGDRFTGYDAEKGGFRTFLYERVKGGRDAVVVTPPAPHSLRGSETQGDGPDYRGCPPFRPNHACPN